VPGVGKFLGLNAQITLHDDLSEHVVFDRIGSDIERSRPGLEIYMGVDVLWGSLT
jgi:hypothetical protein